jgi:hypothetical protein
MSDISSNIQYMPSDVLGQAALAGADDQQAPAGLAPIVPLLAVAGQVALP